MTKMIKSTFYSFQIIMFSSLKNKLEYGASCVFDANLIKVL